MRKIILLLLLVNLSVFSTIFFQETKREEVATISSQNTTEKKTEDSSGVSIPIKTIHFGDLMLDRGVEASIKSGVDPFENVKDTIRMGAFDVVAVNLEGPFTDSQECQEKPYTFRFEPEYVSLLKSAGITAVSISNNHTLDCYEEGEKDTKRILSENGIDDFGGFNPKPTVHYQEINDRTVAFLGFDTTMNSHSEEMMIKEVAEASSVADVVVVYMHWGNEYETEPNQNQTTLARALVASGADLIIGHHPHVLQPAEIIEDSVVFYSLGNFIFDQILEENRTGAGVEVVFKEEATDFRVYPFLISGNQPSFYEGENRTALCDRVLGDISGTCKFTLPSSQ
ncbi:MAG: CapA family protein [Candidatus Campbellbacteria bacterium]|nr:CapA family protein [Candidatus Campbellbacteria bacterium]